MSMIYQHQSGGAALPFILLSAARSQRRPVNPLISLQPASASARAQRPPGTMQIGNTARTLDGIKAAAVSG